MDLGVIPAIVEECVGAVWPKAPPPTLTPPLIPPNIDGGVHGGGVKVGVDILGVSLRVR